MTIEIKINDSKYLFDKPVTIRECFEIADFITSDSYEDNPVAGAFLNNRAVSLSTTLFSSGKLEPIRVFDPTGRRIYRHSLCFILSYAAKLTFPDRHLVIGHSLGDGFYFSFSDGKGCDEETVKAISIKMKELSSSKLKIEKILVPFSEAFDYFKKTSAEATCRALSFQNKPEVEMYKVNDFYDISYEPLVDNTQILSVWKLISYKGKGMLLRYPVSENVSSVCDNFRDNSNLFSVFEESGKWNKILGVSCTGELNEKISKGTVVQYVRLCEALQKRKIENAADLITGKNAKAVFIAGPSSSGKTTFAKKLCEQLQLLGRNTIRISLDDYYNPRETIPVNAKGEPDYECLEALNTGLFFENMNELFSGKEVHLPQWNFAAQERTFEKTAVKLEENSVFVIEGIHGLNPAIMNSVDEKYRFSIYISALTQLNLDDHNRVSTTDNRIIRRIVRDNRTRGVSALTTLSMWSDVANGEKKHVFPFQNNADVMFNSALDYELGVLSPYVTPLLMEVSPENKTAYSIARRLLSFLENFYTIPSEIVPRDSIIREFIGSGDYE